MSAADLAPYVERLRKRIGIERGPVSRLIEKGALIKFAKSIGETHPLYLDEEYAKRTRFGGLIASPTYVSTFAGEVFGGELFDFDLPLTRMLHSDDIVANERPIRAGDVITAKARYADAYVREGREGPLLFQAAEMTLTNQRGERAALVRVASVSF
jgi:acyl dehydratase